jgi:anti-sigma B factor antagonist
VAAIITDEQDGVLIARFQGGRIIDESHIESLGKELGELINQGNKKIVLNFMNVNFMSSAMIGKLIQFGKKCSNGGIALCLCDINENIDEVFKLMKLESMFKMAKDEEAAIKSFSKKGWFG